MSRWMTTDELADAYQWAVPTVTRDLIDLRKSGVIIPRRFRNRKTGKYEYDSYEYLVYRTPGVHAGPKRVYAAAVSQWFRGLYDMVENIRISFSDSEARLIYKFANEEHDVFHDEPIERITWPNYMLTVEDIAVPIH